MFKPSAKFLVLLFVIPVCMLIGLHLLKVQPVLSQTPDLQPLDQPTLVATTALPPSLGKAVLGGKSVYVLYVTRTEDTVLVRCYPTYEPTVTIRTMGSNPNAKDVQKEGVLTCRPSA